MQPRPHQTGEVLYAALGTNKIGEHDWPSWTTQVLGVVWDPRRTESEVEYRTVRDHLSQVCGIPCIEVDGAVGRADPLLEGDAEHGRCSLRLLDFVGRPDVHLVIRQQQSERRMTWSLLHELGHLVCHNSHLLHIGTLYHRISLDPSLEDRVGHFVAEARDLRDAMELEADLFAATWLLPTWMDIQESAAQVTHAPGLTADGYRFYALRAVTADKPVPPLENVDVDNLNRLGEAQRRRAHGPWPRGSYWERIAWAVFNRPAVRGVSDQVAEGLRSYAQVLRVSNPRAIPELRMSGTPSIGSPRWRWIRRLPREEVEHAVNGTHWAPFLVDAPRAEHPPFYIPVRPVPSPVALDSALGWRHMMKPALSPPRPLGHWLDRAAALDSALLVFPRTPAERELDIRGQLRA